MESRPFEIPSNIAIGNAIRRRRKECKMTMKELGELVGVSAAAISRYELGQREVSLDMLIEIATYLHTSVYDLIQDELESEGKIDVDLSRGVQRIMFPEQDALSKFFARCGYALVLVGDDFYFCGSKGFFYRVSEQKVNETAEKVLNYIELICAKLEQECDEQDKYIKVFNSLTNSYEMRRQNEMMLGSKDCL